MAPKTDTQVLSLYEARRRDPSEKWRREVELVRQLMNGDIWAPVSERIENEASVVANNAQIHLDQMARRVVSTQPNVRYTPLKQTEQSKAKARTRELWNIGVWDQNKMKMVDRKRARWLMAFTNAPIQVGPADAADSHPDTPKYTLREPMSTYAAPTTFQDSYVPCDCIFAYKRTYAWVKAHFPGAALDVSTQYTKRNSKLSDDTLFEFVEYIDAEERIILLVARDIKPLQSYGNTEYQGLTVRVATVENRLGECPVVIPSLITVDRLRSPYIDNYGMYIMRNKLAALEYEYAERTVYPERYFVEAQQANGEIVEQADARRGLLGHVRGGELHDMSMPPDFKGTQMIDRLSEEERVSNSTPAELMGQSASNIRTGARGQQIASAAIDFTIQEVQEILELAKEAENRIAVKVYKTYINKPVAFYIPDGIRTQTVNVKPDDFETDENHVFYPAAGTDVNQLVISGGQRIAQNTMSRESFMLLDPLVEDAEQEKDRIQAEMLRQAGFQQLMQPGALDPLALADMAELIASGKREWWSALQEVQKKRQEAQASNGQPGEPNGPVAPGAPEAQPGIAPGAAQPSIAPSPDQQGLSQLLSSLRRPQMSGSTGA